jgi:natural product precursor
MREEQKSINLQKEGKRAIKKLKLNRETIRELADSNLRGVVGGATGPISNLTTCRTC